MALVFDNLGASSGSATAPDYETSADATSYANASWSPTADELYLLFVGNSKAADIGSAPTVTGNGITWANQASNAIDPGAQTHRLTCYAALGSALSAGATTCSFGAVTQSSIEMVFLRITGADLSGGIAGAIVQKPTATANSTSISVGLAAAGNANNRVVAGVYHAQPEDATPRSLWTKLDSVWGSSPGRSVMTEYRSDAFETTASASWTTSGAAVIIALEIKAAAGGAISVTVLDTVGFTDTVADSRTLLRTLSNTLGLTDVATRSRTLLRSLADTVGLTTTTATARALLRSLSNTLGLTDTITKSRVILRSITDGLGLSDVVARSKGIYVLLADVIGFTDSLAASVVAYVTKIAQAALNGSRSLLAGLLGKRDLSTGLDGSRAKDTDLDGSVK